MKKYVRFFAALICLLFCIGLNVKAAKSGDYEYEVNGSQTATITGYTGSSKQLTIPAALDGKKVTDIADNAFYNQGI